MRQLCDAMLDMQAADIVRVVGIGRNEYINLMNQVRLLIATFCLGGIGGWLKSQT